MRFESRVFALPKDPEQPSAYQDAYCMDAERGVATIADGVSSAIFCGPWASILTEAVVADPPNPEDAQEFAAWLDRQRRLWAGRIDTSGLAWFQRAKLPAGAFSTLLWLQIGDAGEASAGAYGGYRLHARAIGDSCLFHVRGGELVRTFPLQSSAELQADPIVLGSVDLKRDHFLQFASLDEYCYPDDSLILCTDAVAEWALKSYEAGDPPVWDDFWKMSDEDWRAGIDWLRHERQMRYDDTTMMLLRVTPQRVENAPVQAFAAPAAAPAAGMPEPGIQEAIPIEEAVPAEALEAEESDSSLDWIKSMSKDMKSVSAQVAEHADEGAERVLQGFKSLKEKALQKYREKFGKKNPPGRK